MQQKKLCSVLGMTTCVVSIGLSMGLTTDKVGQNTPCSQKSFYGNQQRYILTNETISRLKLSG